MGSGGKRAEALFEPSMVTMLPSRLDIIKPAIKKIHVYKSLELWNL